MRSILHLSDDSDSHDESGLKATHVTEPDAAGSRHEARSVENGNGNDDHRISHSAAIESPAVASPAIASPGVGSSRIQRGRRFGFLNLDAPSDVSIEAISSVTAPGKIESGKIERGTSEASAVDDRLELPFLEIHRGLPSSKSLLSSVALHGLVVTLMMTVSLPAPRPPKEAPVVAEPTEIKIGDHLYYVAEISGNERSSDKATLPAAIKAGKSSRTPEQERAARPAIASGESAPSAAAEPARIGRVASPGPAPAAVATIAAPKISPPGIPGLQAPGLPPSLAQVSAQAHAAEQAQTTAQARAQAIAQAAAAQRAKELAAQLAKESAAQAAAQRAKELAAQLAAKVAAAQAEAAREALAEANAKSVIRRELARTFVPPDVKRSPTATQTLIQPISPPDLIPPATPLPSFRVMTQAQFPKIPRKFVAPGRQEPKPPAQMPEVAAPEMRMIQAEPVATALQPKLPMPVAPPPPDQPKKAPEGPPPTPKGDPISILSMNDRKIPLADRVVIPPGNIAEETGESPSPSPGANTPAGAASTSASAGAATSANGAASSTGDSAKNSLRAKTGGGTITTVSGSTTGGVTTPGSTTAASTTASANTGSTNTGATAAGAPVAGAGVAGAAGRGATSAASSKTGMQAAGASSSVSSSGSGSTSGSTAGSTSGSGAGAGAVASAISGTTAGGTGSGAATSLVGGRGTGMAPSIANTAPNGTGLGNAPKAIAGATPGAGTSLSAGTSGKGTGPGANAAGAGAVPGSEGNGHSTVGTGAGAALTGGAATGSTTAVVGGKEAGGGGGTSGRSMPGDVISRPQGGKFDAVIVQSSPLDQYPESRGLLTGRPIYSVYITAGTARDWTLFYCIPNEKPPAEQSNVVRLGAPAAPIQAPYPYKFVRPAVTLPSYEKYVLIHGFVNAEGHFEAVKMVRSILPDIDRTILASLGQWEFRPATKDGTPVAVEFLLSIPAKGL